MILPAVPSFLTPRARPSAQSIAPTFFAMKTCRARDAESLTAGNRPAHTHGGCAVSSLPADSRAGTGERLGPDCRSRQPYESTEFPPRSSGSLVSLPASKAFFLLSGASAAGTPNMRRTWRTNVNPTV